MQASDLWVDNIMIDRLNRTLLQGKDKLKTWE